MDTRIVDIGQLVTPVFTPSTPSDISSLEVRERTELWIRDGRIVSIGPIPRRTRIDQEIDARGKVVLPGLIDPHTHYDAYVPLQEASVSERPEGCFNSTPGERASDRLRRALRHGVTTVEVKCGSLVELEELSALMRAEDGALPEVVATLFGGGPQDGVPHAVPMADLIAHAIPAARRRRLAQFCDVACGGSAYSPDEARTILRAARAAGFQLKLHVQGGELGAVRAMAIGLDVSAVGHANHLGRQDAEAWRRVGVVPVLLPGERLLEPESWPDARGLLDAGLMVALGTNAGSGSVAVGSMWLVLALAVTVLGMSLEQGIAAVTLHNASALELSSEIGSAEAGKRADLVILDVPDYRDLLAGLGEDPVRCVVQRGEVVFPD